MMTAQTRPNADMNLRWRRGIFFSPPSTGPRTQTTRRPDGTLKGLGEAGRPVILFLHPHTRSKISDFGLAVSEGIHFRRHVGYLKMVWLEANAASIAADSDGVQKEAC